MNFIHEYHTPPIVLRLTPDQRNKGERGDVEFTSYILFHFLVHLLSYPLTVSKRDSWRIVRFYVPIRNVRVTFTPPNTKNPIIVPATLFRIPTI